MYHLRFRTAAVAVAVAGLLGTGLAAPALAKDTDVVRRGNCSSRSDWKLKLGPRGSVIETEFEVDSNRVGQTWVVRVTDNGVTQLTRTAKTVAPSGSFSVRKVVTNRAGTDAIVARATNPATGETCIARASV